jgi:peptidyl-prolyl cis-trans isomerase SurA
LSVLRAFASTWTVLIAAGVMLAFGLTPKPGHTAEKLVEGIAAQVGNDIVLVSEVLELSAPVEERMRKAGAPKSEIARVRKDALERLIETKLLSSVVERLELSADREEVDKAIEAIAADNGLTKEQLFASVASHGLTVDEYRTKIRGEIERNKVVNAMVRSRVQISDEEIKALYAERYGDQRKGGEEVEIRHILVISDPKNPASAQAACKIVSDARAEIVSEKVKFSDVAQKISAMNPERGGDLGWMHRKDLASWMSKAIQSMKPGEVSEVIEMPFGCNLLQLVDRRDFEPVTYAQAEDQLRNEIFQQKMEKEYADWLEVLRGQTYIERMGPFSG